LPQTAARVGGGPLPGRALSADALVAVAALQRAGVAAAGTPRKSDVGGAACLQGADEPFDAARAVTVLRAYRARRNAWKLVSGPDWPDTGLFFVRPDGQPWHPETITQRFDTLVAASGLPPVRFHDLRHIAATLMLAAGASIKEIQDTLGHASYTMTADTYTSVLEELKRTTAEATTKLIPRQPTRAA
jgi:hypothetical protein